MTRQDLLDEARKLPLGERAEFARQLLATLEELSGSECEELWMQEVDRRICRSREEGVAPTLGEEVLARARAALSS